MKLTIIGGGVMGSAIAQALLNTKTVPAENLTISDPTTVKLQSFQNQKVSITDDNLSAIQNAEVILIAVKPQFFTEVLTPLQNQIPQNVLVISIAAGVSIEKIQHLLNHAKIIRVMPNTPTLIQKGFSGWFANKEVGEHEKEAVQKILKSFGEEAELASEDQIDAITALSGSGPAYVFLFIQSLIEGGIKLGLSPEVAKKSALQTVLGSVNLALNSEESLENLTEKVTSKGGTTASARAKFAELGFKETVAEAMKSAYKRAKELAKN